MSSFLKLLLLSLYLLAPLGVMAEASKIPHGSVELVTAVNSIQSGSEFEVGLLFQLEPGWHIYWKNPGDAGQPPRLTWDLPKDLSAGEIIWPTPKRLPVGPLLDYGYEGQVLLPIPITAQASLPASGSQVIRLGLRVQVCREVCVPGKAELALTLPVQNKAAANQKTAALFAQAKASMAQATPENWKVSAKEAANSIVLTLTGIPGDAAVSFIPAKPNVIQNSAPQMQAASRGGLTLELKRAEGAPKVDDRLTGLLLVEDQAGAKAYEVSMPVTPMAAPTAQRESTPPKKPQSLPVILLLAFGGGLILNLMPCVFPVLSIKVLSLLDHFGGDRKTVQLSALVYTLGVLLSFWILVAVLLSLRAAGRNLGWGFQLQSPGFVAFLICLLFVFGLSLIGVFEIGTSVMSVGSGLTQRGTYTSSFFTGVLATVVATPCTAPLMGVAVGFALSQGAAICVLVFTSMAIGLAAPFLLLTIFPGLSRFLPRPGAWMETMKQILAFPLFATVVWLLWVLGQQVGINQLALLLFTLLILSMAGWVMGRWPLNRTARTVAACLGIAVTVYAANALVPEAHVLADGGTQGLKWEAFTPQKLAAYRASGKPVLIDFTAAWCLTCQVNDRVVFHSPEVQKHLSKSDIALLRADWTSYDPAITDLLAKYGRSGIPLYVVYGGSANAAPAMLPDGLLTPSGFLQDLEKLKL